MTSVPKNIMNHLFFIFFEVLTTILSWHLVRCQRSEFITNNITHCDTPGLQFVIENFTVTYSRNSKNHHLYARFRTLEDIKAWKKGNLHIERCNDQGLICEHFLNINIDRLCQATSWANPYWYQMVKNIHPPFRCPIKKATYEIQNAIFDIDGFTNWYPDIFKYRWRSTTKIYNERNMLIGCETLDIYIRECKKQDE